MSRLILLSCFVFSLSLELFRDIYQSVGSPAQQRAERADCWGELLSQAQWVTSPPSRSQAASGDVTLPLPARTPSAPPSCRSHSTVQAGHIMYWTYGHDSYPPPKVTVFTRGGSRQWGAGRGHQTQLNSIRSNQIERCWIRSNQFRSQQINNQIKWNEMKSDQNKSNQITSNPNTWFN